MARRLFGDLAYRSGKFKEELAEAGVLLAAERAERRPAVRQQVEVCFATLKRVFRLGETLAKTPVGLVTRIAAKIVAYTYGLYVNRLFGRPWGHIKESWAWNPRNTHLASPVCYAGEYLKPISEPVEEPESLPESHSQFYLRTPA